MSAIIDYVKKHSYPGRFERKYVLNKTNFELTPWIKCNPLGFITAYPKRRVNNIYFDSEKLSCYWENEAGVGHRIKVRVRWYGKHQGKNDVFLELKQKINNVGYKVVYPLGRFDVEIILKSNDFFNKYSNSIPPLILEHIKNLRPVMINAYNREYYKVKHKDIRLTIDTNITSSKILSQAHPSLKYSKNLDDKIIVEIKYEEKSDESIRELFRNIPYRLVKNSKYINALETA